MLTIHLLHHEGRPEAEQECALAAIPSHLRWSADFAREVVRRTHAQGLIRGVEGQLELTDRGRAAAAEAMTR